MTRPAAATCLVAALLSGCVGRTVVREVADDLQAVHTEVELFRRAQDDLARRLAEVEAATQASRAKTEELQAALAMKVSDMERLASQLDDAREAIAGVGEDLATQIAPVPPSASSSAPALPRPEGPTETRQDSAETSYEAGLANFRGREYGQAVLDFLDVVTKHSTHALAPSAQYWIGEAYYLQHDYRQALSEFQKVLDWGPATAKASEALVKVGLCYSNLREGAQAQEAWRRVIREFPDSPSAAEARSLLNRRAPATR